MKIFALFLILMGSLAWACPPCPSGASYSGSGASTSTAGCRCSNASHTWNGSACVSGNCTLDGVTVLNGNSRVFYSSSTPTTACTSNDLSRTCTNGVLSGSATYQFANCNNPCTGTSRTWLTNCAGPVTTVAHGGSDGTSNTNSGYTGTANFSCSNGTWSYASGNCSVAGPTTCNGGVAKSWGAACSGTTAVTNNGNTYVVSNTNTNYTGSATYLCSSGSWAGSPSPSSCTAKPCTTQTINWGAGCSASATGGPHGTARTLNFDDVATYAGSANVTCNFGTWNMGTNDCVAYCLVPGTQITMADGSLKNIEDVRVGEAVRSFDEMTQLFTETVVKEVQHREKKTQTLFTFALSNGKEVTSNDIHRFYVAELGSYVSAGVLSERFNHGLPVTLLGPANTFMMVTGVRTERKDTPVYNIHVMSPYDGKSESKYSHNYFANGVLVHNSK